MKTSLGNTEEHFLIHLQIQIFPFIKAVYGISVSGVLFYMQVFVSKFFLLLTCAFK